MGSCRPLNGSLYTESRENNGFRFIDNKFNLSKIVYIMI